MRRALLFSLCALMLWACGADKRPREPAPIAPPPPPAAAVGPSAAPLPGPATQAPEPDPSPEELPLPEDFEAEAAHQITAANFRAQLDAIEKEMNAQK